MNQNLAKLTESKTSFPLTDLELHHMTYALSRIEQRATATLVAHLEEVDRRKAYALLSYPSLFEYVRKELGYSESSAYERIAAMRLTRQNEKAKQLIESGELTLTGATQVQRFLKEEKAAGNELSGSQQNDLLSAIAGKSKRETERYLLAQATHPETTRLQETTRVATPTHTEVKFFLDEEGMKLFNRARELVRADSTADLVTEALKTLIEKKERGLGKVDHQEKPFIQEGIAPAQKSRPDGIPHPAQPISSSRFIPLHFKRPIHTRSGGQCEYISPFTGTRCPSRAHLQVDHRTPLAHGGKTELNNLRHLCPAHNLKAAMDVSLGRTPPAASVSYTLTCRKPARAELPFAR